MFEANPQSVDQIKETIREAVASISQETLHCVVENLRRCLEACVSAQGGLFESCVGSAECVKVYSFQWFFVSLFYLYFFLNK